MRGGDGGCMGVFPSGSVGRNVLISKYANVQIGHNTKAGLIDFFLN